MKTNNLNYDYDLLQFILNYLLKEEPLNMTHPDRFSVLPSAVFLASAVLLDYKGPPENCSQVTDLWASGYRVHNSVPALTRVEF